MKVAFRVDASSQIGTGHLMRCLTLADALKQRGVHTRLVSRHMPEHFRAMLATKGHEFTLLESSPDNAISDRLAHSHWLGTSQLADARDTIRALSDSIWDWLVVDHYALDERWEMALHSATRNILVIDDLADRVHDCEVLLDQNLHADMDSRYDRKVPKHCRLLLGPRYALLRDEFRKLHEQTMPRSGLVKRILVFFGGIDADNYTRRAIEALVNIKATQLQVDVVIGAQHPCREQLETECAQRGFTCHVQTSRMAELMAEADLSIGAGGTATWERCCLGLPALTIPVAENQNKQIAGAAVEGLLYAPDLKDELDNMLVRHLSALMGNSYLRNAISRNGMRAVDGGGVLRTVGHIGGAGIKIRPATQEDEGMLFEWRNHPKIRAVSRNTGVISWEDHQQWFAAALVANDRVLLIGQHQSVPIGVVRFDIQGNTAEISIYLAPDVGQPGQGRELLKSAEQWIVENRPAVRSLRAHVLTGNERSQRLFLAADYQVESIWYLKALH